MLMMSMDCETRKTTLMRRSMVGEKSRVERMMVLGQTCSIVMRKRPIVRRLM